MVSNRLLDRPRTDNRRRAPGQRGFTLIEMMVVVAIIAIVSAIAVPNLLEALDRTRRTTAYMSVRQIEAGLQQHAVALDKIPATLNPRTLEPLVSTGALTAEQARLIVNRLEGDQLIFYFGWPGSWWWPDGWYVIVFRPKGERHPGTLVLAFADIGMWRWDPNKGWHEVAT